MPRLFALLLLLTGLAACTDAPPPAADAESLTPELVRETLDWAETQLRATAEGYDPADGYPRNVEDGQTWRLVSARNWTSGFFPGQLWLMYDHTEDPYWRTQAERWTAGLEVLKTHRGTHDLGFMVHNSFGQGYRLTQDPAYRDIILETSQTLSERYDPTVGAIRSWDFGDWQFPVIIDNMMNLEMLYWAAANGGDSAFADLATQHARTSLREHIRPDHSTYHVVDFDTTTGDARAKNTHQGYADESLWARGQAWGIYGFTLTYRATQDAAFLQAAQDLADVFLADLPADMVPYWDYRHPDIPEVPRDASAAAITASALFELAEYSSGEQAERYRTAAEDMLASLINNYTAQGTSSPSILLHSVGNAPAGTEIDEPINYADYYFLEALLRYLDA